MSAAKFSKEYFRQQGARGGKKGGKARMERLTPAERSELGRAAAAAKKRKAQQNGKGPKNA
jgi:hypothetical protein